MKCWITTHWPIPKTEPKFARHVYFKNPDATLPNADDIVLVRESYSSPRKWADRCHLGNRTRVMIEKGEGGIIGYMRVCGPQRAVNQRDVVYDYGDLREWRLLQCERFQSGKIPFEELMQLVGKPGSTGALFLRLWQVPDKFVSPLLARLGI